MLSVHVLIRFFILICLGCQFDISSSGESRARAAYEKALSLDPHRADTLYNLANLLKDEDQQRADQLYFKVFG